MNWYKKLIILIIQGDLRKELEEQTERRSREYAEYETIIDDLE